MPGFHWDVDRAETLRVDGCDVFVWNPCPCVLVTRVVGAGTVAALQAYGRRAEREMAAGLLTVFHDWSGMHRYDPDARDELKRWGRVHNDRFVSVSYLVRSKVVAMLISVAALTLGRELRATTDREQFNADLGRTLAAHGLG